MSESIVSSRPPLRGYSINTQTQLIDNLAMRVDEPDANTTYQGWAEPGSVNGGAVWRIRKVAKSGTVTTITWADGNVNFDNIWDNRASLSYS